MIGIGLLGISVYAISALRLRKLPRRATPLGFAVAPSTIAEPGAHRRAVLRKARHWGWKLAVHPVLLGAMIAVFGAWLYLDTNRLSTFSKPTIVLALFFGYTVCSELAHVVAQFRQYRLERRIARHAVLTLGQVLEERPKRDSVHRIRYQFRDPLGRVEVGAGDDLTGRLFEEMQVTVVLDRDHPNYNIPLPGMRYLFPWRPSVERDQK